MITKYLATHSANSMRARWLSKLQVIPLGVGALLQVKTACAVPVIFPETPMVGKAAFTENSGTRVRAILVHGDTIYVGGNFTVSQNGVTRTNVAAFDLEGNLKTTFAVSPNGIVWALATDGKSLFIGGEYTRLGLKKRIASVDLVTGAINPRFTAHIEGNLHIPADEESQIPSGVRSLAVMTDSSVNPPVVRLLVGGNFTQVNSIVDNRAGLAALVPETGDLDANRFTQGVVDGYVNAVLATPTQVFIGGTFNQFQGKAASLGALDLMGTYRAYYNTGTENVTYPRETPESVPKTVTEPLPIIELDVDLGSNRLFSAIGGKSGTANSAAAYEVPDRVRSRVLPQLWRSVAVGGDVQSVHYFDGNLYFGFHDGLFKQPDTTKIAAVDAATGVGQVDSDHASLSCKLNDSTTAENCWLPVMDAASSSQQGFFGVWEIRHFIDPATGMARLIVGGEFTQVGGVANTKRLAIFAQPLPPPPPPVDPPPVDPPPVDPPPVDPPPVDPPPVDPPPVDPPPST